MAFVNGYCDDVRHEGLSTKGYWVGRGLRSASRDSGSASSWLPARAQQVLERLSLYGFVRHAPHSEARHHRAVRASQSRCVWVCG